MFLWFSFWREFFEAKKGVCKFSKSNTALGPCEFFYIENFISCASRSRAASCGIELLKLNSTQLCTCS